MLAYRYTVGLRSILLAIAGEGESERYLLIRERGRVMKATPAICGDHLVPISECDCLSYMREVASAAERLIQLAQEREEMSK
jgi:hypothetical protein